MIRDLAVALVSGLAAGAAVSVPIFVASARQTEQLADRQEQLEGERTDRQEVLENLRFVRDRAADPNGLKPFDGLNLRNAPLAGLDLGCVPYRPPGATDDVQRCADFVNASLTSADLTGANLTGANLTGAELTGANLINADLSDANLNSTDLTDAYLIRTDLTDADLISADLTEATILAADLTGADLAGADLTGADLTGANLRGADLRGADLTGANLRGADLTGVCYVLSPDPRSFAYPTIWPTDFEPPAEAGCGPE